MSRGVLEPLRYLRNIKSGPNLFVSVFVVVAIFQLFRTVSHYSPIYGADEYAYIISGYYRDHLSFLWERDPLLQKLTNPLYLLFVDVAKGMFPDVSAAMRLLSAILYCGLIGASGLYVARQSSWTIAIGCIAVLGVLPSSAYSAAVMPDVPFYCAVTTTIIGAVSVLPRFRDLAAVIAGIGLAVAFLLKPHAISGILATVLFILLGGIGVCVYKRSSRILWNSLQQALIFVSTWYLSLVVFSFLFLPETIWDPRYPLGVLYSDTANVMISAGLELAVQQPLVLTQYELANLLTVLTVVWPFLFILLLKTLEVWCRYSVATDSDQRAVYLFGWLLLGLPIAITVASLFTFVAAEYSSPAEALRVHARYYAFLYLITIVGALSVSDWAKLLGKPLGRPFLSKVNGYQCLAVAWPTIAVVTWFHNRTFNVWFQDNIETFLLFDIVKPNGAWNPSINGWHWALVIVLLFAPFVYLLRPKRAAFLTCVITACGFFISLVQVTKIQHFHSSAVHFRIETGQLLHSVLSGVPDEQILVVGSSRYGETAHVLFGMLGACHVRQSISGQSINREIIPAGVRYVFSVDNIPLAVQGERMFATPAGVLYKIGAP